MKGFQAEAMVKNTVKEMGWTIPRLPQPEKLIAKAIRTNPKMVARTIEALEDEGMSLSNMSSWDVVDLVYGLDIVCRVGDVYVGIDVTINTDMHKLDSKQRRMATRAPMHKALGVQVTLLFNPQLEDLETAVATAIQKYKLESVL